MIKKKKKKSEIPKRITYQVINAFVDDTNTDYILRGNPAAVVIVHDKAETKILLGDDRLKQKIAFEIGLSETAFVFKLEEEKEGEKYLIEWFSPTTKVGLCGHASLASAYSIFEMLNKEKTKQQQHLIFTYGHGAEKNELFLERDQETKKITMQFPSSPPVRVDDMNESKRILDLVREAFDDCDTDRSEYMSAFKNSIGDTFIYIDREKSRLNSSVDGVYFNNTKNSNEAIDYDKLAKIGGRGVVITSLAPTSNATCDFQSRFFAPSIGILEDPVTGSAHCGLAPFYKSLLSSSSRKGVGEVLFLRGMQLSERGGLVECREIQNSLKNGSMAVELRGYCAFDKTDSVEIGIDINTEN